MTVKDHILLLFNKLKSFRVFKTGNNDGMKYLMIDQTVILDLGPLLTSQSLMSSSGIGESLISASSSMAGLLVNWPRC